MYKAVILSFILFFTLNSAKAQCVADFSVNINRNQVSLSAINPTNYLKYLWDFGDGNTLGYGYSTFTSHTYQASGIYDVTLSVYDSVNNIYYSVKKQVSLQFSGCQADFTITRDSVNGHTFHFESNTNLNSDTSAYYLWSINNVYVNGTNLNNSYTFIDTGYYNVCLEVFTDSCYSKICKPVYVAMPEACNNAASFIATINGDSAFFNASNTSANVFHSWHLGDGMVISGYDFTKIAHKYSNPGYYSVLHTIRDSVNRCIDSVWQYVNVMVPDTCVADFEIIRHSSMSEHYYKFIRKGSNYNLPVQYNQWSINGSIETSYSDTIVLFLPNYVMHNICLKVKYKNGCEATVCKDVNIGDSLTCTINANFIDSVAVDNPLKVFFRSIANQSSVQYAWSFGDGSFTTTSDDSPVHTYTQPGTYFVKLFVRDTLNDCSDSTGRYITVNSIIDSSANNRSYLQSYPNPVTGGFLNMNLYLDKGEQLLISIYNANGNIVYSDKRAGLMGNNNLKVLVNNLPKGQYFIDIRHGEQRKRNVFLKL